MADPIGKHESDKSMKKLLSALEAGQYLGVGRSTFLKLAKEKQLTSLRIGKKRVLWDVTDLDKFIESEKTNQNILPVKNSAP